MKYISKGLVAPGSTEHILHITRCGFKFELTGVKAALWLNGRRGFDAVEDANPVHCRELRHLGRMGLAELTEPGPAGEYRTLSRCIIVPTARMRIPSNGNERFVLTWLHEAGLHLTMAEMTFLLEHRVEPSSELLGKANVQALTERIYTPETVKDNALEILMERVSCRDEAVRAVLALLKKRLVVLL